MEILISNLFIYFFEAIIFWQYTSKIFMPRRSKWLEAISLSGLYVGLFVISFFENTYVELLSFACANFIFISTMYETRWHSALFHAAISAIAMGMSELLTVATVSYSLPDFYAARDYFRNFLILSIFVQLLYYVFLSVFSRFLVTKNKHSGQADSRKGIWNLPEYSWRCRENMTPQNTIRWCSSRMKASAS